MGYVFEVRARHERRGLERVRTSRQSRGAWVKGQAMLCCAGGGGASGADDHKFRVIESRWNVATDAIGEGGFGTVHLGTHVKTGKTRAVKAMRLMCQLDREDFTNEVRILLKIKSHRNICHIVDHAEDVRYGYLVMQACSGGELFDRIVSKENQCTERHAAMAVLDVLSALAFIHAKRIVHRDLKPENLLYKDKEPGAPLKLIDFGLALQLAPHELATEVCGTTSYMAPEVIKGQYSTECDLWSLGIIVYFMMSGSLPFPGEELPLVPSPAAWLSVSLQPPRPPNRPRTSHCHHPHVITQSRARRGHK